MDGSLLASEATVSRHLPEDPQFDEHTDIAVAAENIADKDYRIHGSGVNEPALTRTAMHRSTDTSRRLRWNTIFMASPIAVCQTGDGGCRLSAQQRT